MAYPWTQLSPTAHRLLSLLEGNAKDASYWPHAAQLAVGLFSEIRVDSDLPMAERYRITAPTRQRMTDPARELVTYLLAQNHAPGDGVLLTAAALAGMDAEARAAIAGRSGPIALTEIDVVLGWDVEVRALYNEALRRCPEHLPQLEGVTEWLGDLPGYHGFARAALDAADARVAAIHSGEIAFQAEKAFCPGEVSALGRALRLALLRDEPWLPDLLDRLARGVAVAPTKAKTLPSQRLLFEIARSAQAHPTPEAVAALRAARHVTRHGGVPKELDRAFKRIEPRLADRLEVAFRLPDGRVRQAVGEHTAIISIDGDVELSWWKGDKKLRSVPAAVRKEHPDEVKRLRELATLTKQRQATLVRALETGYAGETAPPYRQLEGNPVTDRLIWEFEVSPGIWRAQLGLTVPDVPVRLWHPARASVDEVRAWRDEVQSKELRQPYKQAFREVYLLTPAEEESRTRSQRFAGHVVDYRKIRALFKSRGWRSNYLGQWDGGFDGGDAQRLLAGGRWRATLEHSLHSEGYAYTGGVLFHRLDAGTWTLSPLPEVPPLVFSEAMRDIDLFVALTSITSDPAAADDWPGQFHDYWQAGASAPLPPSAEVRRDALSRLIVRTAIADRCTVTDRFLVVRGDLRTYKIHLGSANILMEPNDAYLCIVSAGAVQRGLFLPFEEDGRLSLILSKAFLLADDSAITDPSIMRQIRR
ncbi:DUF4132 domain-containing protein [Nonomuraea sp. NPDC050663]|uniref:DUF4132 domain-containing protein n=1 Tax=Nonomuraea sp. NPDC050663 TaxID=3364370 RepID=UPI0037B92F0D